MDCLFCANQFESASIKEYEFWDLQIFVDDQYYVGRCVAVFKQDHIVDVTELTNKAILELHNTVLPELQDALGTLFDPDFYNYSSLGNDCEHLHYHIIPRYKDTIVYNGKEYTDEYWGKTYKQEYERVKLDDSELSELITDIREQI